MYLLTKAQKMREAVDVITKCPAAAEAKTRGLAKRKRVEAAPLYLTGRVERDEELPGVEVEGAKGKKRKSEAAREKQEQFAAVLGFVVREMKGDLMVDLQETLGT